MELAIEEWDGQVLGQPMQYITRGSETKAGTDTRRVEKAIDSEPGKFVIGLWQAASPWQ